MYPTSCSHSKCRTHACHTPLNPTLQEETSFIPIYFHFIFVPVTQTSFWSKNTLCTSMYNSSLCKYYKRSCSADSIHFSMPISERFANRSIMTPCCKDNRNMKQLMRRALESIKSGSESVFVGRRQGKSEIDLPPCQIYLY